MQFVEVDGVKLEVQRIEGDADKPPLVFLHEGLGSVAMWRDWPKQLCNATQRAGVMYSRRGYGASDAIPDVRGAGRLTPDYMHREAIEVLPSLLEKLGIAKATLVGHSDGATIALIHACHFHDVQACIAMAPHVIVEDISVKSIEAAREAFEKGDLRERLKRYHADVDCAFWQWNDIWLSPAFRGFDIRSDCRRIASPVLAIQGVDDPYGTLQQVRDIEPAGLFATEVLEQCGHSPHRDQPERTIDAIKRFLAPLA